MDAILREPCSTLLCFCPKMAPEAISELHLYSGKLSREKTFADCSLVLRQRMPHSHISRRKLLRTSTKPQNLRRFSPAKVSRYTLISWGDPSTLAWMPLRHPCNPPSKNPAYGPASVPNYSIAKHTFTTHTSISRVEAVV